MASSPSAFSALQNRDGVSISASFRRPTNSLNRREAGILFESELPVAQVYDASTEDGKSYGNKEEIQLWNPEWSKKITTDGEKFLEEAVCLGYQEDQSLAVLFVCSFDLKLARDRLPKFRNTCIPVWPECDKILFQELLSTRGKNFSSYKNTKIGQIPVKELVGYYYYQKMVNKRANCTVSVLNQRANELTRTRLLQQNLTNITPTQIPSKPGMICNSCFKSRRILYRILDEFVICNECHGYLCRCKKLPQGPAKDPILNFPDIPPVKNPNISGPICTSDYRASQIRSCTTSSYREHRRQLQNLTTAKSAAPSAEERTRIMNQIHNILADENKLEVITLDE